MTDHLNTPNSKDVPTDSVSRRNLLLGMGAVAGAAAGAGLLTSETHAASSSPARTTLPAFHPHPEVLAAQIPGLTYITIDAQQFWPTIAGERVYANGTGTQPTNPNDRVWAALPLPAGSIVYQMSVGYQGAPFMEINQRKINQPFPATAPIAVFQKQLQASPGGPVSTTVNMNGTLLEAPVTIASDSSYTVSMLYSTPGSSIFNVQIGYLPPTQSFMPFTGTPRVFDSRLAANGPKFTINDERTIDLGIAGARTAIINLTVTETGAGGGFVAVFPANLAYPGNSSINWTTADQNVANGVITSVDPTGKIKVRANNATHIVIDRIGFMI
ncbi:MAG: hypothetical protein JWN62_2143 [Acidimicrobiales bacterium]|nr:hypothetical protein [Acidimicrobiales bacterium]